MHRRYKIRFIFWVKDPGAYILYPKWERNPAKSERKKTSSRQYEILYTTSMNHNKKLHEIAVSLHVQYLYVMNESQSRTIT